MSTQFIDGKRMTGSSGLSLPRHDPSTGELLVDVDLADTGDVDRAVAAARRAFPQWSTATPAERAGVLNALAVLLDERAEDYATTESRQAGKPIRLAREFDVPGTVDNVAFFAGATRNPDGLATGEYSADHTSSIRREAIGVVGSIAPWNYPLQMAGWKILPAIAAGNTIVLKPSELTPLTSVMLAEAALEAGLPSGVVNIVTGAGSDVGQHLVGHPDVDMVSFTGSTHVGKQVIATASHTVKRVHMELGGKAPFVVFDDADLEAAVHGAVAGSLINTGQDCTAATRAYVQRPLYDAFVSGVADLMRGVRLGLTADPATDLGPLISQTQCERVSTMVDEARDAGARVVCGGRTADGADLAAGWYYEPTLIVDAAQDSAIVQQEVFGPVLVVLPFDSDDEGIALANDTPFGLAASAWTRDVVRSARATRDIRAGVVWVNDHIPIISEMPHGGYKQSGYGKDMSRYSLEDYTVVKHVMVDRTGEPHKPWHRTIFTL
jgi:betaine-aldehyde dehydrogenase